MKFWQKVFLPSLVVILTVFTVEAYILISNTFTISIGQEIKRELDRHQVIRFALQSRITSDIIQGKNPDVNILYRAVKNVVELNTDQQSFLSVYNNDYYIIYSSAPFKDNILLCPPIDDMKRQYTIQDVEGNIYLLVAGGLSTIFGNVFITTVEDISDIFLTRQAQISDFIKLDILMAIISAIILFLFTQISTRSINGLMLTSKRIASGDYSHRVKVSSADEIGELGNSFNIMADVVQEKVEALEKLAEERGRFVEALTHELKTPLTSIIGYADMLRSKKMEQEEVFDASNYIYEEGKRLEGLSQKLLDMVGLKHKNLVFVEYDSAECLERVASICRNEFVESGITLTVVAVHQVINIEKDLFFTMLINFIHNAVKASYSNSNVLIRGGMKLNFYIIEIQDFGVGIRKKDLDRIFEPFFITDESITRAKNGIGLGLALCKEIAELHGMKLRLESERGWGTVVRLIVDLNKNASVGRY